MRVDVCCDHISKNKKSNNALKIKSISFSETNQNFKNSSKNINNLRKNLSKNILKNSDVHLCVPADRTARIQETHLVLLHCLCDGVDHLLFD